MHGGDRVNGAGGPQLLAGYLGQPDVPDRRDWSPTPPLGRGFLTGTVDAAALAPGDGRRRLARFNGDAAAANQAITDAVRNIAEAKGITAGQVAIAWVAAQEARLGIPVVPIPGTKRVKWIEQNAAALDTELTSQDLAILEPLAAQVVGARY